MNMTNSTRFHVGQILKATGDQNGLRTGALYLVSRVIGEKHPTYHVSEYGPGALGGLLEIRNPSLLTLDYVATSAAQEGASANTLGRKIAKFEKQLAALRVQYIEQLKSVAQSALDRAASLERHSDHGLDHSYVRMDARSLDETLQKYEELGRALGLVKELHAEIAFNEARPSITEVTYVAPCRSCGCVIEGRHAEGCKATR